MHTLNRRSFPPSLRAVMLDWAGTVLDYGSRAPVAAFIGALNRHRIEVSVTQARQPMGQAKRDHIASILDMPEIAQQWRQKHGRDSTDADIDLIYRDFQTIQFDCLPEHSRMIPGAVEAVNECRAMGLAIASSTGYTKAMMKVVMAEAEKQGYVPDCIFCADDAAHGRPAPWLIYKAMEALNVYPPSAVVTVDDTTVGIEAGRNAGTWCVGVALTGNEIGLSETEIAQLPPADLDRRLARARQRLTDSGSHDVVDSVAQLPSILRKINQRLATGELPTVAA